MRAHNIQVKSIDGGYTSLITTIINYLVTHQPPYDIEALAEFFPEKIGEKSYTLVDLCAVAAINLSETQQIALLSVLLKTMPRSSLITTIINYLVTHQPPYDIEALAEFFPEKIREKSYTLVDLCAVAAINLSETQQIALLSVLLKTMPRSVRYLEWLDENFLPSAPVIVGVLKVLDESAIVRLNEEGVNAQLHFLRIIARWCFKQNLEFSDFLKTADAEILNKLSPRLEVEHALKRFKLTREQTQVTGENSWKNTHDTIIRNFSLTKIRRRFIGTLSRLQSPRDLREWMVAMLYEEYSCELEVFVTLGFEQVAAYEAQILQQSQLGNAFAVRKQYISEHSGKMGKELIQRINAIKDDAQLQSVQEALEALPVIISEQELYKHLVCNSSLSNALGYTPHEVRGIWISSLGLLGPAFVKQLTQLQRENQTERLELIHSALDKIPIYVTESLLCKILADVESPLSIALGLSRVLNCMTCNSVAFLKTWLQHYCGELGRLFNLELERLEKCYSNCTGEDLESRYRKEYSKERLADLKTAFVNEDALFRSEQDLRLILKNRESFLSRELFRHQSQPSIGQSIWKYFKPEPTPIESIRNRLEALEGSLINTVFSMSYWSGEPSS